MVMARRIRPAASVRSWFSEVLISGDEGFGSDARRGRWLVNESWFCGLVMSDQAAVGRGGGTQKSEPKRAV